MIEVYKIIQGHYDPEASTIIPKHFMIKVKEGDGICGACKLRHYKCRPCSESQAKCLTLCRFQQ